MVVEDDRWQLKTICDRQRRHMAAREKRGEPTLFVEYVFAVNRSMGLSHSGD